MSADPRPGSSKRSGWHRLAWLFGIWAASVAALALAAGVMKLVMRAVGLG